MLSVSVGTNVKPPDDDSLELEVVTSEAGHCSAQVTSLKHPRLLVSVTANLTEVLLKVQKNNWNIY